MSGCWLNLSHSPLFSEEFRSHSWIVRLWSLHWSSEQHPQYKIGVDMEFLKMATYDPYLVLLYSILTSYYWYLTYHHMPFYFSCVSHWSGFWSYTCIWTFWLIDKLGRFRCVCKLLIILSAKLSKILSCF